jgi:hypothetical protein
MIMKLGALICLGFVCAACATGPNPRMGAYALKGQLPEVQVADLLSSHTRGAPSASWIGHGGSG